jgi:hypothetical protein
MELQTIQLSDGLSYTIRSENIIFGEDIHISFNRGDCKQTMSVQAANALFQSYEYIKTHFSKLTPLYGFLAP